MPVQPVDLSDLDISAPLTLTVAWRSGPKVRLGRVETDGEVGLAFRELIAGTIENIDARTPEAWAPDADLTAETYLVIDMDKLGPAPVLTSEFQDCSLAEVLSSAQTIPALNAKSLPAGDLVFYALTIGPQDSRVTFLRRHNPRRGLKSANFFAGLSDALTRIEQPIFAFDGYIDLVFAEDKVAILSSTAFAALFRSQEALTAQVPKWVADLQEHVPIAQDGRDRLAQSALRVTHLRTRLEAIVTRGHLEDVSVDTLRKAMTANGLKPDDLLNAEGEFILDEADIPTVLYFLNEDLFAGSITELGFRADKKAAR